MKVTKHIEQLLTQGHKPKELIELGFPRSVVTRVRRQLREEKAGRQTKAPGQTAQVEDHVEAVAESPGEIAQIQQKLSSLESEIRKLATQVDVLNATVTEVDEIQARLDGTPALGLKHRFACTCGASGLLALHIRCTKCGRETWWGWHPQE